MGKAAKALLSVLVFAAAAGAAEDEIKCTKSKPITYYPPQTELTQFDGEVGDLQKYYELKWEPNFNADIEHIRVLWNSWEVTATLLNSRREHQKINGTEFARDVASANARITKYFVFTVSVVPMTEDFYHESAKDYWRFSLFSESGEIEPVGLTDQADLTYWNLQGYGFTYTIGLWTNTYHVYFRNTYGQETPEYFRLIVEGGKTKHGFEWRFKENK